jgi:predicted MPP superfamily phosphohydrolase
MLNRLLSLLDGSFKSIFMFSSFVVIVGGFGLVGFLGNASLWILVPILVLLGVIAGEAYRLRLNRIYRSSPPIQPNRPIFSLSKPITTTDLQVAHYRLELNNWDGGHLRIAHLSDLHVSRRLPLDYYQRAIDQANQSDPDLIFITGDFVSSSEYACILPDLLKPLRSRHGVFGILGNHDYWAGELPVIEAVRSVGIVLLYNGWQRLRLEGTGDILLVGDEDPWNKRRWSAPPLEPGELVLALSHSADNIYQLNRAGVMAVFSGHYHAGQIQLPLLGPLIVPSKYGRRFYHGHYDVQGTHLFVSAGIGANNPALRLYCPPDLFVVDIIGTRK